MIFFPNALTAGTRYPFYGRGPLRTLPEPDNGSYRGYYDSQIQDWTGEWREYPLDSNNLATGTETIPWGFENPDGVNLNTFVVAGDFIRVGTSASIDSNTLHVYTGNSTSAECKVYSYQQNAVSISSKPSITFRIESKSTAGLAEPDCVREVVFVKDENLPGYHTQYVLFLIGSSPDFDQANSVTLPVGTTIPSVFPVVGIAQGTNSSRPSSKEFTQTISAAGSYHVQNDIVGSSIYLNSGYYLSQTPDAYYNWYLNGPAPPYSPGLYDPRCPVPNNPLGPQFFLGSSGSGYVGAGSLAAWQANHNYAVGESIKTTSIDSRLGLIFICKTAGYSGPSEPAWPTVPYREDDGQPLEGFVQEVPDTAVVGQSATGAVWAAVSAVHEELLQVAPSAIIELFELHLKQDLHGANTVFYFYSGQTVGSRAISWRGNFYAPVPIKTEGFEFTNAQLPRPTVTFGNLNSVVTQLLRSTYATTQNNDLNGADFIRRRTLAKYLDTATWPSGEAPSWSDPSPDTEFPMERYVVDRKIAETREVVTLELASTLDMAGIRAPKRQCIANVCQWAYRSGECSYNGPPVADEFDAEITLDSSPEAIDYYAKKALVVSHRANLDSQEEAVQEALQALEAEETKWVMGSETFAKDVSQVVEDTQGSTTAVYQGQTVTLGLKYRRGALQEERIPGWDTSDYVDRGYNWMLDPNTENKNLPTPAVTTNASRSAFGTEKRYAIQEWVVQPKSTSLLNAYNTAQQVYDTYKVAWEVAKANRATALSTWQASSTYAAEVAASSDKCGKLLSSCKLRFQDDAGQTLTSEQTVLGELPFGSYPGIGTFLA